MQTHNFFFDKCNQESLNNMFIQMQQTFTVPKKELIISLPYLGKMSQIDKPRLTKTMSKHMKFFKFRVILQTSNTLNNYFHFKDFVPETLRSDFVYKTTQSPALLIPTSIPKLRSLLHW